MADPAPLMTCASLSQAREASGDVVAGTLGQLVTRTHAYHQRMRLLAQVEPMPNAGRQAQQITALPLENVDVAIEVHAELGETADEQPGAGTGLPLLIEVARTQLKLLRVIALQVEQFLLHMPFPAHQRLSPESTGRIELRLFAAGAQ